MVKKSENPSKAVKKSASSEPEKTSVRNKAWKMSAKMLAKESAKESAKAAVAKEVEVAAEVDSAESEPKDISKVKRKRSKDAHQRRRELAKLKGKTKKEERKAAAASVTTEDD
jgi:hypothetical protein